MRPKTVSDEEILEKAREVFIKLGYSAPVTAISKELGVSQPALFKRFGTKENLFISAMRPPKNVKWMKIAEAGPDSRNFQDQFEELLGELFAFFTLIGPMIQVVKMSNIKPANFLRDGDEPIPVKAMRVLSEWIDRCQEQGLVRKLDSRVVAVSILGACHMDSFIGSVFEKGNSGKGILANNQKEFVEFYLRALEKQQTDTMKGAKL